MLQSPEGDAFAAAKKNVRTEVKMPVVSSCHKIHLASSVVALEVLVARSEACRIASP